MGDSEPTTPTSCASTPTSPGFFPSPFFTQSQFKFALEPDELARGQVEAKLTSFFSRRKTFCEMNQSIIESPTTQSIIEQNKEVIDQYLTLNPHSDELLDMSAESKSLPDQIRSPITIGERRHSKGKLTTLVKKIFRRTNNGTDSLQPLPQHESGYHSNNTSPNSSFVIGSSSTSANIAVSKGSNSFTFGSSRSTSGTSGVVGDNGSSSSNNRESNASANNMQPANTSLNSVLNSSSNGLNSSRRDSWAADIADHGNEPQAFATEQLMFSELSFSKMSQLMASDVFKKSGVLWMLHKNGLYKSRWIELAGSNLSIWKSQHKDSRRPMYTITLDEFSTHRVGEVPIKTRKDLVRKWIFALKFCGNKEFTECIFATNSEVETDEWVEVLHLVEIKNFMGLQRGPATMLETLESRVMDELNLFIDQREDLIQKYGEEKFASMLRDYRAKIEELRVSF